MGNRIGLNFYSEWPLSIHQTEENLDTTLPNQQTDQGIGGGVNANLLTNPQPQSTEDPLFNLKNVPENSRLNSHAHNATSFSSSDVSTSQSRLPLSEGELQLIELDPELVDSFRGEEKESYLDIPDYYLEIPDHSTSETPTPASQIQINSTVPSPLHQNNSHSSQQSNSKKRKHETPWDAQADYFKLQGDTRFKTRSLSTQQKKETKELLKNLLTPFLDGTNPETMKRWQREEFRALLEKFGVEVSTETIYRYQSGKTLPPPGRLEKTLEAICVICGAKDNYFKLQDDTPQNPTRKNQKTTRKKQKTTRELKTRELLKNLLIPFLNGTNPKTKKKWQAKEFCTLLKDFGVEIKDESVISRYKYGQRLPPPEQLEKTLEAFRVICGAKADYFKLQDDTPQIQNQTIHPTDKEIDSNTTLSFDSLDEYISDNPFSFDSSSGPSSEPTGTEPTGDLSLNLTLPTTNPSNSSRISNSDFQHEIRTSTSLTEQLQEAAIMNDDSNSPDLPASESNKEHPAIGLNHFSYSPTSRFQQTSLTNSNFLVMASISSSTDSPSTDSPVMASISESLPVNLALPITNSSNSSFISNSDPQFETFSRNKVNKKNLYRRSNTNNRAHITTNRVHILKESDKERIKSDLKFLEMTYKDLNQALNLALKKASRVPVGNTAVNKWLGPKSNEGPEPEVLKILNEVLGSLKERHATDFPVMASISELSPVDLTLPITNSSNSSCISNSDPQFETFSPNQMNTKQLNRKSSRNNPVHILKASDKERIKSDLKSIGMTHNDLNQALNLALKNSGKQPIGKAAVTQWLAPKSKYGPTPEILKILNEVLGSLKERHAIGFNHSPSPTTSHFQQINPTNSNFPVTASISSSTDSPVIGTPVFLPIRNDKGNNPIGSVSSETLFDQWMQKRKRVKAILWHLQISRADAAKAIGFDEKMLEAWLDQPFCPSKEICKNIFDFLSSKLSPSTFETFSLDQVNKNNQIPHSISSTGHAKEILSEREMWEPHRIRITSHLKFLHVTYESFNKALNSALEKAAMVPLGLRAVNRWLNPNGSGSPPPGMLKILDKVLDSLKLERSLNLPE